MTRPDLAPACLMTIHAHPDDEASKGAPTLASYHRRGVSTVLVCCTGGEEGDLQNPGLREPGGPYFGLTRAEERAAIIAARPGELQRSAEAIGFDHVEMLGYRDSGMVDTAPNEHPACFHQAPMDEAVGRLVGLIRRHRP
ncbi:MAG: PIG-L family deacetylase, partial [Ilumatobacteraceae bacterium]